MSTRVSSPVVSLHSEPARGFFLSPKLRARLEAARDDATDLYGSRVNRTTSTCYTRACFAVIDDARNSRKTLHNAASLTDDGRDTIRYEVSYSLDECCLCCNAHQRRRDEIAGQ